MNDYGFKPATLFGLVTMDGDLPNETDRYDPDLPRKGNTKFDSEAFNFSTDENRDVDLRLFFWDLDPDSWSECRWGNDAPEWWRRNLVNHAEI
jgi:hypothetical protein